MWTPLRRPLTSSILRELQWFHAVNSEAHLRHALHTTPPSPSSSSSSSSYYYVGLEIDVHACPHDPHAVLLRHDATPLSSRAEEYTFEDFVDQLSASLSANAAATSPPSSSPSSLPVATTVIVLAVLKIDCKTPEAWRRLLPTLESTRRRLQLPKLCLWMNADVVAGPPPSPSLVEPPSPSLYPFLFRTNNSEESSSSPHEWLVQELLAPCLDLQVGLSLGWTTHPSSTTPYSNEHVEEMMELLRCLWSRCPQTDDMLLTFPVRYSLVFVKRDNNNEPQKEDCRGDGVAAMQRMLSLAAACVCKHLPCGDRGHSLPPVEAASERSPPHSNNNASSSSSHWCGESVLPFLTFWRGRDEIISDSDTQRCLSLFYCTVDRS